MIEVRRGTLNGSHLCRVAALLSGIVVGLAVAITSLIIVSFSETPLGRLFVLLEVVSDRLNQIESLDWNAS